MKTIRNLFALALVFALALAPLPSKAQFADQANYGATAGGSANALTVTIPNWTRNLPGVPLRFIAASTNTTAATLNVSGLGAVAIQKKTNGGLAALVGGEIRASTPTEVLWNGSNWVLNEDLGQFVSSSTLANSALAFDSITNLTLTVSVAANQLTIAAKTNAGADASASEPIIIPFRDSVVANGGPVVRTITAAKAFTIASSQTMGCANGAMCRLWVLAIDNTGTVDLCAYNALSRSPVSIIGISEQALQTSASGTSGGSSAQTLYCSASSVSNRPVRYLGYIDIQEVTAGTWSTAPSLVQLIGAGSKLPGDIVKTQTMTTSTSQVSFSVKTSVGLGSTLTLTSAANPVRVQAYGQAALASSTAGDCWFQIFKTTGTTGIGNISAIGNQTSTVTNLAPRGAVALMAFDIPNASSQQYDVYGTISGNTCTFNSTAGSVPANSGILTIDEIMG